MKAKDPIIWVCLFMSVLASFAINPRPVIAWGPDRPVYTMESPSPYITFNSIIDNPDVGDERNYFRVRPVDDKLWNSASTNGWTDSLKLLEGEEYEARIYVENSAADNLKLIAENTRVMMNMPTGEHTYGKQFEINAFISSSNSSPREICDNIVLTSDDEFHLEIISSTYYNNVKTEANGGFALSDELFQEGGTLIGYKELDGRIRGTYLESGYVIVRFRPVYKDPFLRFLENTILDKLLSVWEIEEAES